MAGTPTPRLKLPLPAETDPADVPLDLSKLATALDSGGSGSITGGAAFDNQGTIAQRPAPTTRGAYYFATDQNVVYRSDGTTWRAVDFGGYPINTYYTIPAGTAGDIPWSNSATLVKAFTQVTGDPNLLVGAYMITPQKPMRIIIQGAIQIGMGLSGATNWVGAMVSAGSFVLMQDIRTCVAQGIVNIPFITSIPIQVDSTTPIKVQLFQGGSYAGSGAGSLSIIGDYV